MRLYEERTNPDGPAMTHAMSAIGWLEVGEPEKAEKAFLKNYKNIEGPFKVGFVLNSMWFLTCQMRIETVDLSKRKSNESILKVIWGPCILCVRECRQRVELIFTSRPPDNRVSLDTDLGRTTVRLWSC